MLDPLRDRIRGRAPTARRTLVVFLVMLLCSAVGLALVLAAVLADRPWLAVAVGLMHVPYWYYQRLPPAV